MLGRKPVHPLLHTLVLGWAVFQATADTIQQPVLSTQPYQVVGTQVNLTCRVVTTGSNAAISWTPQLYEITPSTDCIDYTEFGIISCSSVYTFTPRWEDDNTRITCTASQGSFTTNTSDTLNLILKPPGMYPLIAGPHEVIENEAASWTCTAREAKPKVTLKWEMEGVSGRLDGTQTDEAQADGTYTSVNTLNRAWSAPFSDVNSTLTCVMTQGVPNDETRKNKPIYVTYAPRITVPVTTYTTRETVNARLECSVDARPKATLQWFKDGNSLDLTSGKYKNNVDNSLILEIVSSDKTDGGDYTCVATNSLGKTTGQPITLIVEYKPRVSIPSAQYIVNISQQLTIIPCQFDAVPATLISVAWQYIGTDGISRPVTFSPPGKYGGGSVGTPSLTIYNVQPSEAGTYTCRCDNLAGFGVSDEVEIKVNFPPTNIQINATALYPAVDERAVLACTAEGEPSPSFSWVLVGDPDGTERADQGTFVIASVQRTDKGRYQCRASNMLGSATRQADINVQYKPYLTPESSSVAVDVGKDVQLGCVIDANPIAFTITWSKDPGSLDRSSGRISGGEGVSSPSLNIANVQENDAGVYSCTVTNSVGSTSNQIELSISFSPRDVTITPSGNVINLKEFEAQTLVCSGFANPDPEYTWKAGNELIATGANLVIESAGPGDNREVTCEVTNSKGSDTATTRINVSYKPRVTIPGGEAYGVDESKSLTIPCHVHANPEIAAFHWLKDGSVLDLSDTIKYVGGTFELYNLTIKSLSPSDAGIYNCRARNTEEEVTSRNITVSISYKPTNVEARPPSLTVTRGEDFSVTCTAEGAPSPTTEWTKGGNAITEDPVLSVTSVEEEDAGIYTCTASNDKGSDAVSVIVSVYYLPRVSSPTALVSGQLGDAISIECEIDAKPEIDSVLWIMLNATTELIVETSNSSKYRVGTLQEPSLTIFDLDPDDVGRYLCKGSNSVGWGTGSPVTVMLSYAPSTIELDPTSVSVTEGERIAVTCNSDGAPSPSYVWFRDDEQAATGGILVLESAGPEHNGDYTCVATNTEGSVEKVLQINVNYKPRGTEVNPTVSAKVGETATLTCAVTANPPVTSYQWSFDGNTLEGSGESLQVLVEDESSFGSYTCLAANSVGNSSDIVIKLQKASEPDTGASVASLSTPILILIILLIIILIIISIVVVVICYKKGKLCKKTEKSRVQPAVQPTAEITPRAEDKPVTDAHGGLRSPQWSAMSTSSVVSRQHVSLEADTEPSDKPQRLSLTSPPPESFEDELKPNGTLANGSIEGGTTISIPGDTPRPHHLPSLDRPPGEEKPKKRKKRRKRKDLDNVDEQGE